MKQDDRINDKAPHALKSILPSPIFFAADEPLHVR
jgi:hypothetical protein